MRGVHLGVHRERVEGMPGSGDPPLNERFNFSSCGKSIVNDEEARAASVELFAPLDPSFALPKFASNPINGCPGDLNALKVRLLFGTTTKIPFNVPIKRGVLVLGFR